MEDLRGRAVVSVRGRDKGKVYIVTSVIDDYFVTVSDGKKKPFTAPKRKNRVHLEVLETDSKVSFDSKDPDDTIRSFLKCHIKEDGLPDVKR